MLQLKKMNKEKFKEFSQLSQTRRKKWFVDSFDVSEEEAAVFAKKDFERILVDGFETKDNFTYSLIDKQGRDVGYLWHALRKEGNIQKSFICDILVKKESRGQGYGRKALELLEEEVKGMGLRKIGLHVYANNSVALGLYKSMGYEVSSYLMNKIIRS